MNLYFFLKNVVLRELEQLFPAAWIRCRKRDLLTHFGVCLKDHNCTLIAIANSCKIAARGKVNADSALSCGDCAVEGKEACRGVDTEDGGGSCSSIGSCCHGVIGRKCNMLCTVSCCNPIVAWIKGSCCTIYSKNIDKRSCSSYNGC